MSKKNQFETGKSVSHLLYGGIGIIHSFVGKFDNVEYFNIGWVSYNSFPKDYDYDTATPSTNLELLITSPYVK